MTDQSSEALTTSTTSTLSAPSSFFCSGRLRLLEALTTMSSRASSALIVGSVRDPSATRFAARLPAVTTNPTLATTIATELVAVTHTEPSNAVPAGPPIFIYLRVCTKMRAHQDVCTVGTNFSKLGV